MPQDSEYSHSGAFPLEKLVYCLVGIIVAEDYFGRFVTERLLSRHSAAAASYSYLTLIFLPLVSGIVVIFLYKPFSVIFSPVQSRTNGAVNWLTQMSYGIGGGLVVFAVSIPFLLLGDTDGEFVAGAISHASSINGLPMLLLLIVALPVVMEVTFRGITFRTLAIHANVPSAVVASSFLFAHLWPAFGRPIGIILGIFSALLYLRTNSLLPSILANAVLSLSSGIFILSRALMRH
jgi:membrane protease YdiL (CAAX protease family)